MRRLCSLALVGALAGCGNPPPVSPPATGDATPIRIVATERGPEGGLLVVIDEAGDRQGTLVTPPAAGDKIRDTAATFSPDGRWVVFASSRGRSLEQSSLWIVRAAFDATPVRLTDTSAVDLTPAWTPAGDAIVFASSRSGSIDLWRIPIAIDGATARAAASPEQLTSAPGNEMSPTVAADGRIAFAAMSTGAQGMTSAIHTRAPDGTIATLEPGPGDASPAFDRDGKRLAFTRPTVRKGDAGGGGDAASEAFVAVDQDLWVREDGAARRVVDLPFTDESGPVWSVDGRWLFATSVVRKRTGDPILSSVIHVDLWETPPVARMLVDRAGAVARLAPALAPVVLDAAALHADPPYVDELRRILTDAIERNESARQR
jgi:dipeptidyl aminopeptidase/acylaminoacyl peptidase